LRKIRTLIRAFTVIALATAPLVHAQSAASKPIRLICPVPPAGAVDTASRAIATELAKVLGQSARSGQARSRIRWCLC
jgi:tripartite-type tricarboxylate transporter receptor subunit TctC